MKKVISKFLILALIVTSGLFFVSTKVDAAISSTPVQQNTDIFSSATRSAFTTTSITGTSGNLIVLNAQIQDTGSRVISTVTGGGVTTWIQGPHNIDATGLYVSEIWYGISNGGSGTVVVTMTSTAATCQGRLSLSEWSGAQAVTDGTNSNTAISGNINTGSITPTSGENVLVVIGGTTQSPGPSGGDPAGYTAFTSMSAGAGANQRVGAYQVVPSTSGSYSGVWTLSGTRWTATIAAFVAASSASTSPVPKLSLFGFLKVFGNLRI